MEDAQLQDQAIPEGWELCYQFAAMRATKYVSGKVARNGRERRNQPYQFISAFTRAASAPPEIVLRTARAPGGHQLEGDVSNFTVLPELTHRVRARNAKVDRQRGCRLSTEHALSQEQTSSTMWKCSTIEPPERGEYA